MPVARGDLLASMGTSTLMPGPRTNPGKTTLPMSADPTDVPTVDVYSGDTTALLGRLVGYFDEAETSTFDARQLAEKCRDYYDGKQWSEAEMAILRNRKQPVVVSNYIKRKIDLLQGLERRGRSDPKAFPRTPDEDGRADAATQALRYVSDDQRYDVVRSSVFGNMLIEGYGGCEVIVEPDGVNGGYNVIINHIPWDRLFYDPHSCHPGFTDARYLGVVIWMDKEEALERYPGCDSILATTFEGGSSTTFDDKPRYQWSDRTRRRVRVVQIWWIRGRDWWTATFTKGGFLEEAMKSPYEDRHGNATCPLVLRSVYVDRELNRYGPVKDLISTQDSINKRESKLMHALSVNRVIAEQGAVADARHAQQEAAKPDGFILVNPGKRFDINKDSADIQGQFELLQHAVQQMNVSGPNASMAGKDPREQSGRAILAQQSGGQLEFEPIADALRQHTHKVFEAAWMRIKQFWTGPKWIRVTDDQKNVKFVGLNHPVTLQEELQKMDPQQAEQIAQQLQLMPGDPRLNAVVNVENDLSDMDVDITVEEGEDSPNLQIEQYQAILQLPPFVLQNFPPAFFIEASNLRNKDKLLQMLEEHQQQNAASQQQVQQTAAQMDQAKIAKIHADTAKTQADTGKVAADTGLAGASTQDKQAQAMERMHGIAAEHAAMAHQPVVPGVGPIAPEQNPLLQPEPAPPAGPAT